MTDLLEIRYSKTFAYFAFIILVGLISLLTFIVLNDDPTKWKGNGLFYLGIMDVILFVSTAYFIIKYLIPAIKGRVAIVINNNFITDNIRSNKIPWDNVKAIRNLSNRSSNFIAIDLKKPQEITSQTKSIFKKMLYASNKLFYGTPILIATQFLEGSSNDLINQLLPYLDRQKLLATGVLCNQG